MPVVAYGPTDDFPAFYSRRSGFKVLYARSFEGRITQALLQSPWRIDDPVSAAKILCSCQRFVCSAI